MCNKCVRLRAAGASPDELPSHMHGFRHTMPIEQRQAAVKDKMKYALDEFPPHLATQEIKAARLRAIIKRMGITNKEMAYLLKMTPHYMQNSLDGYKPLKMVYLELAEEKLRRFLVSEQRKQRGKKVTTVVIPAAVQKDTALKMKVLTAYARGTPNSKIAADLALRPEVVQFFLSNIKDE